LVQGSSPCALTRKVGSWHPEGCFIRASARSKLWLLQGLRKGILFVPCTFKVKVASGSLAQHPERSEWAQGDYIRALHVHSYSCFRVPGRGLYSCPVPSKL